MKRFEKICVLGGSGFVGTYVVSELVSRGYQVRVPTRRRESSKHLILLPTVEVVEANIHDAEVLEQALTGCDAVINLVGILHGNGSRFGKVHAELPKKIVAACQKLGIQRLLHMSALNAAHNADSLYLKSKAAGEDAVCESGLDWTILRPSVIFGDGKNILRTFARLQAWLPVIFLAGAKARLQPVYVVDVARAFAISLEEDDTIGQRYALVGPQVYTLKQLMEYVGEQTGYQRCVVGMSRCVGVMQASLLQLLPGEPLLSADNMRSLAHDSVCADGFPKIFGSASALSALGASLLANETPRGRYQGYRSVAGR